MSEQVISSAPTLISGYVDKSICCLIIDDMKGAQAAAEKALELDPRAQRSVEAVLYVAAIRGDDSRVEKLLAQLRKILDGSGRYDRDYALALVFEGKNEEAVKFCSGKISETEKTPELYLIRAEAYKRLKKNELADADMKKAVEQGLNKNSGLKVLLNAAERHQSKS